jgi:hypothetical protein
MNVVISIIGIFLALCIVVVTVDWVVRTIRMAKQILDDDEGND